MNFNNLVSIYEQTDSDDEINYLLSKYPALPSPDRQFFNFQVNEQDKKINTGEFSEVSSNFSNNHVTNFEKSVKFGKLKKITNPDLIGPGVWYVIHILAISANTLEKSTSFISTVRILIENFPCLECRYHALEFWNLENPENYIFIQDSNFKLIGMFLWSWKFHNAANRHSKKLPVNFEDAYEFWNSSSTCSKNCRNTSNSSQNEISESINPKSYYYRN